jgi:hypothetical protein
MDAVSRFTDADGDGGADELHIQHPPLIGWSVMAVSGRAPEHGGGGAQGVVTKTDYVIVRGELWSEEERRQFGELMAANPSMRIIIMSSYMTFPGKNINPHDDPARNPATPFVNDVWRSRIVLWCHCFRCPERLWVPPAGVPRVLLSESDFYDPDSLKPFLGTPKKYDFFCSFPGGQWSDYIRQIEECKRWVDFIAEEMGLRVLVVGSGRAADFSRRAERLTVIEGDLPWDRFVTHMASCRYMLNTSYVDASPRVVIEAMSLNMPVLLNERILGGWKYINNDTGRTFRFEQDRRTVVSEFLFGRYRPRAWVAENVGPRLGARRLAAALRSGASGISEPDAHCDRSTF